MYSYFLLFFYLIIGASALSSPPAGAITVGPGGKYSKLSDALKDTSSSVYFIFPGTYTDTAIITRPNVRVYGQTNTPGSYTGNTVTITNNIPASVAGSNDASGTVQVHAENVALYNLNIANTYGKEVDQAQAIALSVQAGQFGAYGLKITGDQDTLLANVGAQFYANSWIEGAVDFIFGMRASIWITRSVINTIGSGCITASGRSSNDGFWYVIDSSTVQGTGTAYLGRPWRDYARVVFQKSTLGSNVGRMVHLEPRKRTDGPRHVRGVREHGARRVWQASELQHEAVRTRLHHDGPQLDELGRPRLPLRLNACRAGAAGFISRMLCGQESVFDLCMYMYRWPEIRLAKPPCDLSTSLSSSIVFGASSAAAKRTGSAAGVEL